MIDVIARDGGLYFKIGPHEKRVEKDDAQQMGQLLREEAVEAIASFEKQWQSGSWKIEGAADDTDPANTKSEGRRRLLLHHGPKKWHILRREAVLLGSLFRSLPV
jgi:hypothetical protein